MSTATPTEALHAQLGLVAGRRPRGLIEVRYRLTGGRTGMGQAWLPCRDPEPYLGTVLGLGAQTDTYVGAAPRTERNGAKQSVRRSWCLWVDCDDEAAASRLREFRPAPSLLLRSGRDGGLHGWWALREPLSAPYQLERALRRLAHHLSADSACCDSGRIMRAAGTFNFKRDTPVAVEVERLECDAFTTLQVVGQLPDPPRPARPAPMIRPAAIARGDDPLLSIAPTVYVEALTGREVGRDGKLVCSFHEDRTPSLHVYDTPERGWTCFGCSRGGSIIDFGAALYGIEPRGAGYHELRRRLATDLLGARAAA